MQAQAWTADDWAALATWGGVVVAIAAAFFAGLQARRARQALKFAREQAEAAKDQAHTSRINAEASSKASMAAMDQASSAREAVELARKESDRADRPQFEIRIRPPKEDVCRVTIRMIDGPPGVRATVMWLGEFTWPVNEKAARTQLDHGQSPGSYDLFKNGELEFGVNVKPQEESGTVTEVTVRVIVESSDMADPERTWEHVEIVQWKQPPLPRIRVL